jgi:HAMP domain-containing protein
MDFLNLRLPVKIMAGYLIGCIFVTLLFSISIFHVNTLTNDYNSLVKNSWRQLNALQEIRANAFQLRLSIEQNDDRARSKLMAFDFLLPEFIKLSQSANSGELNQFIQKYSDMRQKAGQLINARTGTVAAGEETARYNEFSKSFNIFIGQIMVDSQISQAATAVAESNFFIRVQQLLLMNVILSPLNFLFLYFFGLSISNYLAVRLKKISDKTKAILAGNYQERIEEPSRDELGEMSRVINELASRLESRPKT